MTVAVCVHRYRPWNPRYRAVAPLLEACASRGMRLRVIVADWAATVPAGVEIATMPRILGGRRAGWRAYSRWASGVLRRMSPACAVGFDPLPGLDIRCAERHEADLAAGKPGGPVLAGRDLPPGLPPCPAMAPPLRVRDALGLGDGDIVLVMFGGDLAARGFERVLVAISRLPEASRRRIRLLAAGDLAPAFVKAVRILGLDGQVRLAGHEPETALATADLLVDLPYRAGSNGLVFDALAAGVPVLAAAGVSESALATEADAGVVLNEPFVQADCNAALERIAGAIGAGVPEWRCWRDRARRFAADPSHYGQTDRLLALIDARLGNAPRAEPRKPGAASRARRRGNAHLRA